VFIRIIKRRHENGSTGWEDGILGGVDIGNVSDEHYIAVRSKVIDGLLKYAMQKIYFTRDL